MSKKKKNGFVDEDFADLNSEDAAILELLVSNSENDSEVSSADTEANASSQQETTTEIIDVPIKEATDNEAIPASHADAIDSTPIAKVDKADEIDKIGKIGKEASDTPSSANNSDLPKKAINSSLSKKHIKAIPLWVKIIVLFFFGAVLVLLGLVVTDIISFSKLVYVEVPNVVQMSVSEAKALLNKRGLNILITSAQQSTLPAGTVVMQYPIREQTTLKNEYVSVTVSSGNPVETDKMPDLTYMQLSDAYDDFFAKNNIKVSIAVNFSEEVIIGGILKQNVQPGTLLTDIDNVVVTISEGSESAATNQYIWRSKNLSGLIKSTVIFYDGNDVYNIASTNRNEGVGSEMPGEPKSNRDDGKVFICWVKSLERKFKFTESTGCIDIVYVYAYYDISGTIVPTEDPFATYTPPPQRTPNNSTPTPLPSVTPTVLPDETPMLTADNPLFTPIIVVPSPGETPADTQPLQPIDKVIINPSSLMLWIGESFALSANTEPAYDDVQIAWSSDDDSIATVNSDGIITAKSVGEVLIYATANGKVGACRVSVYSADVVDPTPESIIGKNVTVK